MNSNGQLVVVGSGIQLGRHISQRAQSEIEAAEVVFSLADPFATHWLNQLRPDLINLTNFYADDKDRRISYGQMEKAIVDQVQAGKAVCAVFYGHPGVFARVPHRAIAQVREAGLSARMEPGISAEDCLIADLGLDPGHRGLFSCEATQFLINRRSLDPAALVILWQVALTGNLDCVGFEAHPPSLELLVGKLLDWYEPDTEIILYEAALLPIEPFRAEHMALTDLPAAAFKEHTTLVIPPSAEPLSDQAMIDRLRQLR